MRVFEITATNDSIEVRAGETSTLELTVTNTTDRNLNGLIRVVPDNTSHSAWISVHGDSAKNFAPGGTQKLTIKFSPPVKTSQGKSKCRILVADERNPDENFADITLEYEVEPKVKPSILPWILIACGVLVVIAVVVIILLILRKPDDGEPTPTPDVTTTIPPIEETPAPQAPTSLFQGVWFNKDPKTRSITKLEIKQSGTKISVHAWGKCSPKDCDWGTEKGTLDRNSVTVTWDQGFAIKKMKIVLMGNQLQAITDAVYDDNRPRRQSKDFFVKKVRFQMIDAIEINPKLKKMRDHKRPR